MKYLAIVGCGATAVTFLRSFIQCCISKKLNDLTIIIFEPAETLGVGLAYQDDFDSLLINRSAQTMSAHPTKLNEFYLWLQKNPKFLQTELNSAECPDQPIFPPRKVFGFYLNDILKKTINKARRNRLSIKIVKEAVEDIQPGPPFDICTTKQKKFTVDYLILALGHNQPLDIYKLGKTTSYINSPYPLNKSLLHIPGDQTIGVIGNSLTAIDVVLSLHHLKHQAKITMLSRAHIFPRVRGLQSQHTLKYLTEAAIRERKEKFGKFTLRDVLRLLRKDLKQYGYQWKTLFVAKQKTIKYEDVLIEEILHAYQEIKWQSILSATNEIIEEIWNHLDFASKRNFLRNFQRIWLNIRSPIPVKNATILLHLLKQKNLSMETGLKNLEFQKIKKAYEATFEDRKKLSFDWIINASGPAREVGANDDLLFKLIQKGMVQPHPLGGIDVDFATAAVIDKQGHFNSHIRSIGHNTVGVYNYVSSLEMIAKKADKIAQNLFVFINEGKLSGQNPVANTADFNRISHFAKTIN